MLYNTHRISCGFRHLLAPTWGWTLLVVASIGGCADAGLPESESHETQPSRLDLRLAALTATEIQDMVDELCSYAPLSGEMTWIVPGTHQLRSDDFWSTAVVTSNPRTGDVNVNGGTCATGPVKYLTLVPGDPGMTARVVVDYRVGNRVFLKGSARNIPGIRISATGPWALEVRGTSRADNIRVGATGLSLDNDANPEIAWNDVSLMQQQENRNVDIETEPTIVTAPLTVDCNEGNDVVSGLGGRGTGTPFPARMRILGGAGDDVLCGGSGDDVLEGGEGNDRFTTAAVSDGADLYRGGPGDDTMTYANTAVSDRGALGVVVTTGAWVEDDASPLYWRTADPPLLHPAAEPTRCVADVTSAYSPRRAWALAEGLETSDYGSGYGSGRIRSASDDCWSHTRSLMGCLGPETEGDGFDKVEAVIGTAGADVLMGGGCDRVSFFGGEGDDILYPGLGNEGGKMFGQGGDDLLLFGLGVTPSAGPNGSTAFDGGSGVDMLICPGCSAGLQISINGRADDGFRAESGPPPRYNSAAPCGRGAWASSPDRDNVRDNIEVIEGGPGDDLFSGAVQTRMFGGGPGGRDFIFGGPGTEYLYAGSLTNDYDDSASLGDDGSITLPFGPWTGSWENGNRRRWAALFAHFKTSSPLDATPKRWPDIPFRKDCGGGSVVLCGFRGDDTLSGSSGRDWLYGGPGDDILLGFDGDDVLSGGRDQDWLEGNGGADVLSGGHGADLSFCASGPGADSIGEPLGRQQPAPGDVTSTDQQDRICWASGGGGNDPALSVGPGWARRRVAPELCGPLEEREPGVFERSSYADPLWLEDPSITEAVSGCNVPEPESEWDGEDEPEPPPNPADDIVEEQKPETRAEYLALEKQALAESARRAYVLPLPEELLYGPPAPEPNPATLVAVGPGTFTMGSPLSEFGRYVDETQTSVTLTRGFLMQTSEVTQDQWAALSGGARPSCTGCGGCPVDRVTWWSALGYANALSNAEGLSPCYTIPTTFPHGWPCVGSWQEGTLDCGDAFPVVSGGSPYACTGYRLPTEAEWEFAARAGSLTATYGGTHGQFSTNDDCPIYGLIDTSGAYTSTFLVDLGWFRCNSAGGPKEVMALSPNAWGLHDMLGNVAEWTWDSYAAAMSAPGGTDPQQTAWGDARVVRGGYWESYPTGLRAAARGAASPDRRERFIGFRLVRSAP